VVGSTRTRPGGREFESLTRAARAAVTFIQVARGAAFADGQLALEDLEPTTIWLAQDPPHRMGHMATGTFLDLWWHDDSGLAAAGLRGVLGRADPDAQLLGDAVLRLRDPRISGSGLRYGAVLLNGSLPRSAGACVLFLGPGDAPRPRAEARRARSASTRHGRSHVERQGEPTNG
jgi:hypothetical protein